MYKHDYDAMCDVKRVDFYFALLCLLSMATVCVCVCAVKRQNEEKESEKQSKFPRNETKTKKRNILRYINTMKLISKYNKEMF